MNVWIMISIYRIFVIYSERGLFRTLQTGLFSTTSLACILMGLASCGDFQPSKLGEDQMGYSRAVARSEKSQTLLNVIRLRYGDVPTFLDITQIISSYQLQRSVTGGFEVFPITTPSSFLTGAGSAQLQESPTFTFQPISGEQFAKSFLQPLSPVELLPLVVSGFPVDVLFRLTVQSLGSLHNVAGLVRRDGQASADFFHLLGDLRRLQIAGILGVRLDRAKDSSANGKVGAERDRILLTFAPTRDEGLVDAMASTKRLLGLRSNSALKEVEVMYGQTTTSAGQVHLLTRSIIGVLEQLAFEAEVPIRDVAIGRTLPTVDQIAAERRPVVVIHAGPVEPRNAFTAVQYGMTWFWIDEDDFDSKVAFSAVNVLLALAKVTGGPGAVLTIPTR